MTGIRIEIDNPWDAYLKAAEAKAKDMTPAMRKIAELAEQRIRNTFRLQEDPWGDPWAEWAWVKPKNGEPYQPVRRHRQRTNSPGGEDMILFDTTALFTSIGREWGADYASVSAGEDGESKDYAEAHQFGTDNLPQRAFMPILQPGAMPQLAPEWYDEIVQPLEDHIYEAFK